MPKQTLEELIANAQKAVAMYEEIEAVRLKFEGPEPKDRLIEPFDLENSKVGLAVEKVERAVHGSSIASFRARLDHAIADAAGKGES